MHAKNVPLVTCTNFLDVTDANVPRSARTSNAFTHAYAPTDVSAVAATSRGTSSNAASATSSNGNANARVAADVDDARPADDLARQRAVMVFETRGARRAGADDDDVDAHVDQR